MFGRTKIMKSTGNYSDEIKRLKKAVEEADAVVIGAGAGLSISAGFVYNGERFEKYFSDFGKKYGFDVLMHEFTPYFVIIFRLSNNNLYVKLFPLL